ncbi:MAG: hypothetical protein ACTSRT_03370 [Promethearchaeota archaeon]
MTGALGFIRTGIELIDKKGVNVKPYGVLDLKVSGKADSKKISHVWLDSIVHKFSPVELIILESPPKYMTNSRHWTYFCMGRTQGIIESVCERNNIKLIIIDSKEWKKHFDLMKKGKEGSLKLARELFPELKEDLKRKKDHNRAEALLITKYGMKYHEKEA